MRNKAFAAMMVLLCPFTAAVAHAGQPQPWQLGFQEAASPIMRQIRWFEQYTLWFIVPITLFVLGLLIYVALKFRASANPEPSRVSHNTLVEVAWTVAPMLILFFLAIPSFNLLNAQLRIPEPDLTVKTIATQWLWSYEYEGENPVTFDSFMLREEDRAASGKTDTVLYPRLLAVDNEMVVPVDKTVRLLVTAAPTDVIHSFALPAFGIKIDAVPGRLNETWFRAEREGIYYGQCSELCGKDHAYMPIAIRVVSQQLYDDWLVQAAGDLDGANRALSAALERPVGRLAAVSGNH